MYTYILVLFIVLIKDFSRSHLKTMPRISFSTDYVLGTPYYTLNSLSNVCDRYYQTSPLIIRENDGQNSTTTLSPDDIDKILSRKLYEQLKITSKLENGPLFYLYNIIKNFIFCF